MSRPSFAQFCWIYWEILQTNFWQASKNCTGQSGSLCKDIVMWKCVCIQIWATLLITMIHTYVYVLGLFSHCKCDIDYIHHLSFLSWPFKCFYQLRNITNWEKCNRKNHIKWIQFQMPYLHHLYHRHKSSMQVILLFWWTFLHGFPFIIALRCEEQMNICVGTHISCQVAGFLVPLLYMKYYYKYWSKKSH